MRLQWPTTPRASKTVRYILTGLIAAVPGIWAIITDNSTLGLVTVGIVLVSILVGPRIDNRRAADKTGPSGP